VRGTVPDAPRRVKGDRRASRPHRLTPAPGWGIVWPVADRTFLLLHGFSHHRPPGHWQYWLANRLRRRGERVLYPGLPFEDDPRYEEWREALHWSLRQMGDGERIVICNSVACLLWMRVAMDEGADEAPVDRLLLVSPPDTPHLPPQCASFGLEDLDGPAVRASVRSVIRIACSDDDPFNPGGGDRQYAEALGAEVDLILDARHIGPIDGYGPWPSLEDWCLDPAVRLVRNFT
jgi:uncharacterized protein